MIANSDLMHHFPFSLWNLEYWRVLLHFRFWEDIEWGFFECVE